MNNVLIRSLSGILYVVIFVGCILLGPSWFFGLTIILTILATLEYMKLVIKEGQDSIYFKAVTMLAAVSLVTLTLTFPYLISSPLFTIFGILLFISLLSLMFMPVLVNSPDALHNAVYSFFGILYIAVPFSLLNLVYSIPPTYGHYLILISLICIWLNDTGAFCVGCTIGKHRLCERLSPKKSWEGFWGGVFCVVLAMAIFAIVTDANIILYCLYGFLICVFATVGDLFESLLKRRAGVKDSGKIIPGHGGILDRIDSLLYVSICIFIAAIFYH